MFRILVTGLVGLLGVSAVQAATLDISIAAQGGNYTNMVADAKLRGDTAGALEDANLGNASGGSDRFYANYFADGVTLDSRKTHFLQRFDVSSIPPGSTINSATLTEVFANDNANGRTFTNVNLSRLKPGKDWVEGVGQNPATDGSVTWNSQVGNTIPWATPGATDAADIDLGTTQTFDLVGNPDQVTPTTIVRDITAWVQDWVNTPTNNTGMLWWGGTSPDSDTGNRHFLFGVKEDGEGPATDTAPVAPTLVIDYTPSSVAVPNITSISLQAPVTVEYCWTNFAGSLTVSACGADGLAGNNARFGQIYGLDINGAGDTLFVADRTCSKIQSVTVPGAVVTTLASGFSLVELAVNKVNGNVYFPDLNDGKIKKLVPPLYDTASDVTSTGGYGNGLAVDSAADTVYASKTGGNQIDKIENAGTSPAVTLTIGSGTAANTAGSLTGCSLNAPMGGWVSGTGASAILYWADRVPGTIMKIDLAGDAVSIVAGSATGGGSADGIGTAARFDQPHNVAVGPDGNLYVADQQGGTVRKITLPGAEVTTIGGVYSVFTAADGCGTNSTWGQLGQLTVDGAGNIYTGDRGQGTAAARISKGTPVASVGCNVQIDFTAGATDTPGQFTLQRSSPNVTGTYADVAATITSLGAGSFRAIVVCGTAPEFFRIKR